MRTLPAWTALRAALGTIRGRLIIVMALLLISVVGATLTGVGFMRLLQRDMNAQLAELRASSSTTALLQAGVLNEIAAAEAYLASPELEVLERFHRSGLETHQVRRQYGKLKGLGAAERVLVDSLGRLQALMEVDYSLAHALRDIGRGDEARGAAARARGPATAITQVIQTLGTRSAATAQAASDALARSASDRETKLAAGLALSTLLGIGLAVLTLRAVESPLAKLVRAAERLGEGDLRPVDPGHMATEFAVLGRAFATTSARLRSIVKEVVDESERIAASAGDLSAISEQLAASSGEISTSMMEISGGAEQQARRLADAGAAAGQLHAAAGDNAAAAERVATLGAEIRVVAARHRADVAGALDALLDVRSVVRASAAEVQQLARSSESIDEFVLLVKRIASQTNLLALNAAIEAARAGEHGRGFAVVAEEVRKLADESAAAAEQVTETIQHLRDQVDTVSRTMEDGVEKVQGVETVSQGAARGLEEIVTAVAGVEEAARKVADAASINRQAADNIRQTASAVNSQAGKHAAAAESVTAAAEQQSASTQEMAAAAGEMLAAGERLRKAVSGFRL
jgi:methyl-accepting chemotaxis protein